MHTWYGPSLDLKRPTKTRPPIWLGLMMRVDVLRLLLAPRLRVCLPCATTAAQQARNRFYTLHHANVCISTWLC
jgi:hypothetical protein